MDTLTTLDEQLLKNTKEAIMVVQNAVNFLTEKVTGWRNLQYQENLQKLVMEHPELGILPLDLLSDGVRNMVIMISDIAFRCYKLNPHMGSEAAQKTSGVVMIDEVDMFLHPSWQQKIISSLRQAFPKLQFIVTTHSPQVLTTVKRENIRILSGQNSSMPLARSYAEPSGDVLQGIMAVDPIPPVEEKNALQQLTELVDQGLYNTTEAQAYLAELREVLGDHHPQLQRVMRSIKRQEALNK